MIGSLDPSQKKVTVIGAGISGLLIAYTLKKRGFEVSVLEASDRVGGLISTVQTPFGIVERAAHSLLVTPEAQVFFQELGVELQAVHENSRARFIYRNGKMRRMPLRFVEFFHTLLSFFSKPKTVFIPSTGSLEEWGHAYLGKAATRFLLAPFVTGVYACAPKDLLASIAFPKLLPKSPGISLFRHLRSGKKSSRPKMMAPKDGVESIVLALAEALKDNIQTGIPITELPSDQNIILAVPTSAASKMIAKVDSRSAEALLKVKYAPLITVTCFFNENAFPKKPSGVGVLIPRNEGLRILGCLFNSSSFSGRTTSTALVSLTVMIGGTEDLPAIDLTDDEITLLIHRDLEILFQMTETAIHLEITRWPRAIPIYSLDLKNAQDSLKTGFCAQPGSIVFSNFSKDVSVRGLINASLHL